MRHFGESVLYRHPSSGFQKFLFFLFGHDFIGAAIRLSHFSHCLNKYLKKHLKQSSIFLDAGCGTGDFAVYVAEHYPNTELYAYDIKENVLTENKRIADKMSIKNVIFKQKDLLLLNEKEKYDLVFSIGTLIYFSKEQTRKIVENLTKSLKKGGYLYIDLPQEDFLEVNIIPKDYYAMQYQALKNENSGDLYTFDEMKQLLEILGLQIIFRNKSFGYSGKLAWELNNLLLEKGWNKLRIIVLPLLKFLCFVDGRTKHKKGCCYVLLARK